MLKSSQKKKPITNINKTCNTQLNIYFLHAVVGNNKNIRIQPDLKHTHPRTRWRFIEESQTCMPTANVEDWRTRSLSSSEEARLRLRE